MKKRDIENELRKACEKLTPDVYDEILAKCEKTETRPARMPLKRVRRRTVILLAAILSVLALAVGFGVFFASRTEEKPEEPSAQTPVETTAGISETAEEPAIATIYCDAGTGVTLTVGRSGKVLSLQVPDEAKAAALLSVGQGEELETAIAAIALSSSGGSGAALISVDCAEREIAEALCSRAAGAYRKALKEEKLSGEVLTNVLSENERAEEIAQDNGISPGKAAFIVRLVDYNPVEYPEEKLANMVMSDLVDLCVAWGIRYSERIEFRCTIGDARQIAARACENEGMEPTLVSSRFSRYTDNGAEYSIWLVCIKTAGEIYHKYFVDVQTCEIVGHTFARLYTPLEATNMLAALLAEQGENVTDAGVIFDETMMYYASIDCENAPYLLGARTDSGTYHYYFNALTGELRLASFNPKKTE